VIQSRTIPATAERVWQALADFGGIHQFNPMVERVEVLSEKERGLGASRRCVLYDRRSLEEQVIDWREGSSYTVSIEASGIPIKNVTTSLSVAPAGRGSSVVTMESTYQPRFGPLGSLLDVLMTRGMLSKAFARVLKGLEDHLSTGRLIGKNGRPEGTRPSEPGEPCASQPSTP
jgi:hypothetical protein